MPTMQCFAKNSRADRRDARKLAEYFATDLLIEFSYSGFGVEIRAES